MLPKFEASEFPLLVKGIRTALKMTQSEMAYAIGVEQATISRWENGGEPSIDGFGIFMKFLLSKKELSAKADIPDVIRKYFLDLDRSRHTLEAQAYQTADVADRYIDRLQTVYKVSYVIGEGGFIKPALAAEHTELTVAFAPRLSQDLSCAYSATGYGAIQGDLGWYYMIDNNSVHPRTMSWNALVVANLTDEELCIGRVNRLRGTNHYILMRSDMTSEIRTISKVRPVRAILPNP